MKAVVSYADLYRTASAAAGMVGKRHTVPILGCVVLQTSGDALTLTATDYSAWVQAEFPGALADGVVAINARRFADALKAVAPKGRAAKTATVTLVVQDRSLVFSVDSGPDVNLSVESDAADFPTFPTYDTRTVTQITTEQMAAIVRGVLPAMSRDNTIPMLNAVHLYSQSGDMFAEATDRYRAHRLRVRHTADAVNVNIPADVMALYGKLFKGYDGTLTLTDNGIDESYSASYSITNGPVRLVWRGMDSDFPKIGQLFPHGLTSGIVDRTPLIAALKSAAALLDRTTPVMLHPTATGVDVTAYSDGEARFTTRVAGCLDELGTCDATVGFNPTYLIAALQASPTETVRWRQSHPMKPAVFEGINDGTWQALMMPMRIAS